jgi:hypothetical protein
VLQLLKNMMITCHVALSHSDDAATSYRDDALHWHLILEDSYSYVPVLMKETWALCPLFCYSALF